MWIELPLFYPSSNCRRTGSSLGFTSSIYLTYSSSDGLFLSLSYQLACWEALWNISTYLLEHWIPFGFGHINNLEGNRVYDWLPRWLSGKEFACQCRRCEFDFWVGEISWSRKWQPTPVFCLENSRDTGAWQAAVHRVAKSQTWLSTQQMLHNIVLVSTIHQHESAIGILMSPLSWISFPPPCPAIFILEYQSIETKSSCLPLGGGCLSPASGPRYNIVFKASSWFPYAVEDGLMPVLQGSEAIPHST